MAFYSAFSVHRFFFIPSHAFAEALAFLIKSSQRNNYIQVSLESEDENFAFNSRLQTLDS
jgi:hypothetical protein